MTKNILHVVQVLNIVAGTILLAFGWLAQDAASIIFGVLFILFGVIVIPLLQQLLE